MSIYDKVKNGINLQFNGTFKDNVKNQKMEIEKRRKLMGMDKLPINWENNIEGLYEQMEVLGSHKDGVIITPITNKWKDISASNMEGIGYMKLDMEGTLSY